MIRTRFLVAVMGTIIGLVVIGSAFCADPEKATPAGENAFAGKILVVSVASKVEFGATLEKVQVRNLGGKPFLVGTAVDDGQPGNWAKGRTLWLPLDDVDQIVEFPNLEELKKGHAQFQAAEL